MSLESLIDAYGMLADVTVEAPTGQFPPQDPLGGADRTLPWQPVASGIPCIVNSRSSQFGRDDARSQIYRAMIYFRSDPVPDGMTTRHRITVTSAGTGGKASDLGVYAVKSVVNPNTMGRILQVDCERIVNSST